jgi:hypothetical protein
LVVGTITAAVKLSLASLLKKLSELIESTVFALVAVAAFPVIDIPAVHAEILAGVIVVILAQFHMKLVAFTVQFTSSF